MTTSTNTFFLSFCAALLLLGGVSLSFFSYATIGGDGIGYVDAIQVLEGGARPDVANGPKDIFTIHRLLTTPLGIEAVRFSSAVFGSIVVGWFVWAFLLFFLINVFFYRLLERIFRSDATALIGGFFFAGNYAMITAGLGHFMDIGGWFFYVVSISCLYSYIETKKRRDLWLATLAIAIGGLFKENAYVAAVPLAAVVFYETVPSLWSFIKRMAPLTFLVLFPAAVHHLDIYHTYGYYYTYWIGLNLEVYHYPSRILEYAKSLGSLLTFLAPLSLAGALVWLSGLRKRITATDVFIGSVLISSIPALMWPGITQRVLFVVVPGLTLLAAIFVKKYEQRWYLFLPLVVLYILGSFLMDSFILDAVNLPF